MNTIGRSPVQKLSKDQLNEYVSNIERLRAMGVEVGSDQALLRVPMTREKLRLEQLENGPAYFYAMPGEGFIFVAALRLTVLTSNFLTDRCCLIAPWERMPLELDQPEDFLFYKDILAETESKHRRILNPCLLGDHSLRHGRKQGPLIAKGRQLIPPHYPEDLTLNVELLLSDERDNEFRFTISAQVSRRLKNLYELRQRRTHPTTARVPLFDVDRDDSLRQSDAASACPQAQCDHRSIN